MQQQEAVSVHKGCVAAAMLLGGRGKVKERVERQDRNCPSPVACVLFMYVSYSTDTDIKAVVNLNQKRYKKKKI